MKDFAGLAWFICHKLSMLLGQSCPKIKNHGLGNGYCAENHESHYYQTRLGSFKRKTGQRLTVALIENKGGGNQDACC